ncbi:DDE_3 domain-containing protein [Trichonephila clavipes]|nr:DDE_3 domain-containing protein [Trichonephila clavipes]
MRGTLTGQRYVDDILRPHVGPFLNGLTGAIFQPDNARPHTARVAQDFLHHFQTLPWPARSPDLSPVEHVWDQLKRLVPSFVMNNPVAKKALSQRKLMSEELFSKLHPVSCFSSLKERILNVVADRAESNARAVAHHVNVSHHTVCRVLNEDLPFSVNTSFESNRLSSPTSNNWYSNVRCSCTA